VTFPRMNVIICYYFQDGIQAASSSTQQAIQLVVHRIYEYLVSALAGDQSISDSQTTKGLTLRLRSYQTVR
jgi:hypothetical protein